jgi:hypothetical protein
MASVSVDAKLLPEGRVELAAEPLVLGLQVAEASL